MNHLNRGSIRTMRIMRENGLVSLCARKKHRPRLGRPNEADRPNVLDRCFGGWAPRSAPLGFRAEWDCRQGSSALYL
jgi:hypothetical protein